MATPTTVIKKHIFAKTTEALEKKMLNLNTHFSACFEYGETRQNHKKEYYVSFPFDVTVYGTLSLLLDKKVEL